MKLKFSYILPVVVAVIVVTGVSRAYALIGPGSSAPSQPEIQTPINNSGELQIKKGALITKRFFGGGLNDTEPGCPTGFTHGFRNEDFFPEDSFQSMGGGAMAHGGLYATVRCGSSGMISLPIGSMLISPWGFFTKVVSSSLIVGGMNNNQSDDLPTVIVPVNTDATSLKLDLAGRGTGNNSISGTQAISVYAGNMCSTYATVRFNSPEISFVKSTTGSYFDTVDVLARQVRLTAGKPKPNSVLIGTVVGSGGELTSVWGTAQVVNGQIQLVPNP